MADVIFANRIGGLDGVRRNVAVVLKTIFHDILGAVVAGTLVVAVFTEVMIEADAVGQAVLVYEVHKLIHCLRPYDIYVSAYR